MSAVDSPTRPPEQIRAEMKRLEREIAATREKRDRVNKALAQRLVKKDRLRLELEAAALPTAGCIA